MITTPTPPGVDPSTFKFVVNGRTVYEPFAKQVEYHQCTARYPLYGGSKGCGKLLTLDTPIPTPDGWTTMGDLRPGDIVFDADGQPTTVEWCSDIEPRPDAWELEFDDGVRQVCDAGHEWLTLTNKERIRLRSATDEWRARRRAKRPSRGNGKRPDLAARNAASAKVTAAIPDYRGTKRTTAEIVATLTVGPGTINHCVVNGGALALPEATLPIDPYVLGAWLGDGTSRGGGLTGIDAEIWQRIERAGYTVIHGRDRKSHYIRGLVGSLRALGVFGRKHIPAVYLRASRAQREALLQGLMDTDGYCRHDHGSNEFTTTSSALRDGVMELVASLGIKATCLTGTATLRGRVIRPKWRICFTTPIAVYHLRRKADRQRRHALNGTHDRRYIVAARPVPSVPMRCIGVAARSRTYLCGRAMIPTHNSIAIRFDNYGPCLAVPGLKCLILRRQLEELKRSHLRFVPQEAQHLGAKWKPSDVGAGVLYFPNGSLIEFGHCNHEDNINNYLSAEYGRISFDEIITFSELMYLLIRTSCRTTIPGFVPRVGGGTNPVSKKKSGGYWAKRRWILRDITDREDEAYRGGAEYAYIKALPSDNPHLNWVQYEAELASLPPSLRAAYRDGDWDASEDGFFSEFRRVDKEPLEDGIPRRSHVVEFPRFSTGSPRWCGFDWGYQTDEGVCLWAVYDDDGHLYIEDEFVFNGPTRDRYIVKEIAQQIAERNRRSGIDVRRMWCDPKMAEQSGHESVETRLSTFQKHIGRLPCVLGERDRQNGWARLRAWLRNHPDGTPFLKIHPRCKSLIRSIGEAAVDDRDDEDLDTHGYDHPIDALRFLVSGLKQPIASRVVETQYPPGSIGHLRQQAMLAESQRHVLGYENVRR